MKPTKVTVEAEREAEQDARKKALCDDIIHRAALMMINEVKAPMGMMLDRLLTYSAAQACTTDGSPKTAEALREMAAKIDAGLFHRITGEGKQPTRRH